MFFSAATLHERESWLSCLYQFTDKRPQASIVVERKPLPVQPTSQELQVLNTFRPESLHSFAPSVRSVIRRYGKKEDGHLVFFDCIIFHTDELHALASRRLPTE
jgi:hypothetical protein